MPSHIILYNTTLPHYLQSGNGTKLGVSMPLYIAISFDSSPKTSSLSQTWVLLAENLLLLLYAWTIHDPQNLVQQEASTFLSDFCSLQSGAHCIPIKWCILLMFAKNLHPANWPVFSPNSTWQSSSNWLFPPTGQYSFTWLTQHLTGCSFLISFTFSTWFIKLEGLSNQSLVLFSLNSYFLNGFIYPQSFKYQKRKHPRLSYMIKA